MNTCCGGKHDRLCLRWSRCGAASDSRAVQPFHSRSGDASPAPCQKSSGEHSRGQCRTRRSLLWRLRRTTLIETNLFQLRGRLAMKQKLGTRAESDPASPGFETLYRLLRSPDIQTHPSCQSRSRRCECTTELLGLSQSGDDLLAAVPPSQRPDRADQSIRDSFVETSGSNAIHS
jgi:hypothetical protein